MRDVLNLYPRLLVFCGVIAAFLLVLLLVPASMTDADATTITNPVRTTAADTRQLTGSECRLDQHAYSPSCQTQGRTIRVINY